MAEKIRVGFVGTGGIAGAHLRELAKMRDVELVAFCDVIRERAQRAEENHGGKAFTSAARMYDSIEMDAVFICLPPHAHGNAELGAIQRGIPFIVEKPVDLKLAQAERIAAEAKKKGLITATAYMNRYRKGINEARKLFAKDPPVLVMGGWIGGSPPPEGTTSWFFDRKRSGGQFHEQVTHTVDLARYFCGEASEVSAFATTEFNRGIPGYSIDDAAVVNVRFRNGAVANLVSCVASNAAGGVFLTVHAKNATAKFDGWNHDTNIMIKGKDPKQIPGEPNIFEIEDKAFIKAVKTGDPSGIRSTYADGVETMRITIAANKAIATGKVQEL